MSRRIKVDNDNVDDSGGDVDGEVDDNDEVDKYDDYDNENDVDGFDCVGLIIRLFNYLSLWKIRNGKRHNHWHSKKGVLYNDTDLFDTILK